MQLPDQECQNPGVVPSYHMASCNQGSVVTQWQEWGAKGDAA